MDKTKQPGINFDGIILAKENFWRDYYIPEDVKLDLNFEAENKKTDDKYALELKTSLKLIYNNKEVLILENMFVGFFSVIKGSENMDADKFMKNNAPAIMVPYVREHISTITLKAGIKPILIPPLNIRALMEGQR